MDLDKSITEIAEEPEKKQVQAGAALGARGSRGVGDAVSDGSDSSVSDNSFWLDSLSLDDDMKKGLSKFKDIEDLAKSYRELEKKFGEQPKGVSSPEAYEWDVPEGIAYDDDVDKEFRALAHELNITQDQFSGLQEFATDIAQRVAEMDHQAEAEVYQQTEQELKAEWGHEFEARLKDARKGIISLMGNDGIDWAEAAGVANDPNFIRMMAKIGESVSEHSFHDGSASIGLDGARAKIETIMGDLNHPYHQEMHPSHNRAVEEMAKLYGRVYGE